MKNLIDWAVNTLKALPPAKTESEAILESQIVLFTSLSILLDHRAEAEKLPEVVKASWNLILKCEDKAYLKHYDRTRFHAGACNFNHYTTRTIREFMPKNRDFEDRQILKVFREYYSKTPFYSGCLEFPVKHPEYDDQSEEWADAIYTEYWDEDKNMWGRDPYGQSRWDMVESVHALIAEDLKNADFNL